MKRLIIIITVIIFSIHAIAQPEEYNYDTITFETPYQYLHVDNSTQNVWQIGEPDKEFFDAAFSGSNAIITDTVNPYPKNCNSYFELYIGNYNIPDYPYSIFLEIKHKYETEKYKDGGFITVSYDNGKNWVNIINDTIADVYYTPKSGYYVKNLYSITDTLFNGQYGFSGGSKNWITTQFGWSACLTKSLKSFRDTMIIRFNFISDDNQKNKEGWMIDNIRLFSMSLPGDIEIIKNKFFRIYPNPITNNATIELQQYYNKIKLEITNIEGKLLKYKLFYNSKSITVNLNDFTPGIYFMKIKLSNSFEDVQKIMIK